MTTAAADPPSITLRVSSSAPVDRWEIETQSSVLQETAFAATGVIYPIIEILQTEELSGSLFQLQIGDDVQDSTNIESLHEGDLLTGMGLFVAAAIKERAADFVDTGLARHYLMTVEPTVPALVAAVREHIGVEKLTERLRKDVARGDSIRDFPGILEQMLVELFESNRVRA